MSWSSSPSISEGTVAPCPCPCPCLPSMSIAWTRLKGKRTTARMRREQRKLPQALAGVVGVDRRVRPTLVLLSPYAPPPPLSSPSSHPVPSAHNPPWLRAFAPCLDAARRLIRPAGSRVLSSDKSDVCPRTTPLSPAGCGRGDHLSLRPRMGLPRSSSSFASFCSLAVSLLHSGFR